VWVSILSVNKDRIAENFGKAAFQYDESAALQRDIGEGLWQEMEKHCADTLNSGDFSLLDLGCGSGYFTEKLRQKTKGDLIGLDIASGMLRHARQRCESKENNFFVNADAERLAIKSASVGAIFSNFVLQWCENLHNALEECLRILKPGGCLGFSIPISGTLLELRESWQKVDNYPHVNSFFSAEEVKSLLLEILKHKGDSDLTQMHLSTYYRANHYATFKDVLKDLKHIGANTVKGSRNRGLMGKTRFASLEENYEQFRQENGLPVSYQVLNVVVKKYR